MRVPDESENEETRREQYDAEMLFEAAHSAIVKAEVEEAAVAARGKGVIRLPMEKRHAPTFEELHSVLHANLHVARNASAIVRKLVEDVPPECGFGLCGLQLGSFSNNKIVEKESERVSLRRNLSQLLRGRHEILSHRVERTQWEHLHRMTLNEGETGLSIQNFAAKALWRLMVHPNYSMRLVFPSLETRDGKGRGNGVPSQMTSTGVGSRQAMCEIAAVHYDVKKHGYLDPNSPTDKRLLELFAELEKRNFFRPIGSSEHDYDFFKLGKFLNYTEPDFLHNFYTDENFRGAHQDTRAPRLFIMEVGTGTGGGAMNIARVIDSHFGKGSQIPVLSIDPFLQELTFKAMTPSYMTERETVDLDSREFADSIVDGKAQVRDLKYALDRSVEASVERRDGVMVDTANSDFAASSYFENDERPRSNDKRSFSTGVPPTVGDDTMRSENAERFYTRKSRGVPEPRREVWRQHIMNQVSSGAIGPFHHISMRATSLDAADYFAQFSYWRPDIIFLDSAHRKDETFLELEAYFALLPVGGVLIGDDWDWVGVREDVIKFRRIHRKEMAFSLSLAACAEEEGRCYYFYVIQRVREDPALR